MSRGLGEMQRRILAALQSRPGGDWVLGDGATSYGFKLAAGIHDLRLVSRELARRYGGISHCDFTSPVWQASFSRAVRCLAEIHAIEAANSATRQCRFVSLRAISEICSEFSDLKKPNKSEVGAMSRFAAFRQNFITLRPLDHRVVEGAS